MAAADETGTNPGAVLREVIAAAAPWLRAPSTQFTLAQTLTEAVATSLARCSWSPSRRRRRTTRSPATWRSAVPVSGRRWTGFAMSSAVSPSTGGPRHRGSRSRSCGGRLFQEPDAEARRHIAAVAKRFQEMYIQHTGEFPRGCGESDYAERFRERYPIHPELFDRLYQDWSTLERSQRTRGVLRLMSAMMAALWNSDDSAPMIMPGTLPLDHGGVVDELTSYLEDQWKTIIDTDVEGRAPRRCGSTRNDPCSASGT